MFKKIIVLVCLVYGIDSQSQSLKLEEIMKGESFVGIQPTNEHWSVDGKKIYFQWNPNDDIDKITYYWEKGMAAPQLASAKESIFSKINLKRNPSSDLGYYIENGALYSYSVKNKTAKKLLQQTNPISNLKLAFENGVLFFEQNGNILKYNAKEGTILQLTNFKEGKEPESETEKESFLKSQQNELFQFIRDQEAKKKWNTEKTKDSKSDFSKTYFYGKSVFENLNINPQGNFATFRLTDKVDVQSEKMEAFITKDGYNQTPDTKEKVSVNNLVPTKFGIYSVARIQFIL
jgi:hypothetical protein